MHMPRTQIKLSLSELIAEVRRRQKKVPGLKRKAARLEKQLAAIREEIAALGGAQSPVRAALRKPAVRRKRARNKVSLSKAILGVLSKETAKPIKAIIKDVQKAGYKSTSKNFATIIHQALAREKKQIVKAGRGLYRLKG